MHSVLALLRPLPSTPGTEVLTGLVFGLPSTPRDAWHVLICLGSCCSLLSPNRLLFQSLCLSFKVSVFRNQRPGRATLHCRKEKGNDVLQASSWTLQTGGHPCARVIGTSIQTPNSPSSLFRGKGNKATVRGRQDHGSPSSCNQRFTWFFR